MDYEDNMRRAYTPQGLKTVGATVSSATSSSVTVGTASTSVVAANADRQELIIVNASDTDIFLKLGTGAALNSGIYLKVGGAFVTSKYTGEVTAISSAADKILTVTEL